MGRFFQFAVFVRIVVKLLDLPGGLIESTFVEDGPNNDFEEEAIVSSWCAVGLRAVWDTCRVLGSRR
jgi:hypothetical protein